MVADVVFHDLVASPTPHNLPDHHQPHREGKWAGAIKEEMGGNVKEFLSELASYEKRVKNSDNS